MLSKKIRLINLDILSKKIRLINLDMLGKIYEVKFIK